MSKMNKGLYSSATEEWATPLGVFVDLDREFGFTLDPCATEANAKCAKFYTKEQDGLAQGWGGERVFCNPPYGRKISAWVEKAFREVYAGECELCVMLIPARTDTEWFHRWIWHKAEVRFIRRRLRFGESDCNAPFPSMVVIYRRGE